MLLQFVQYLKLHMMHAVYKGGASFKKYTAAEPKAVVLITASCPVACSPPPQPPPLQRCHQPQHGNSCADMQTFHHASSFSKSHEAKAMKAARPSGKGHHHPPPLLPPNRATRTHQCFSKQIRNMFIADRNRNHALWGLTSALCLGQVLEIVAEEGAEAREYLDLLTAHPVDGETSTAPPRSAPQQDEGLTPKLGAAKQQARSSCCALRVIGSYQPSILPVPVLRLV